MKPDLFTSPDYFHLDELLTEEHRLIRDTSREWVKKEVSPIIEIVCQTCKFPNEILPKLGELGCFGPFIPAKYGGAELDQISYGLIMQELERGDSGIRSTASVQSSLVMYPIFKYGSEEQRQRFLPKLATGDDYDVSFLGYPHRHIFHFKVWIEVFHDDRDIEFIQFKRWLENMYSEGTLKLDYKSCEMMSDDLYIQITKRYPGRKIEIDVSEDGENGSHAVYERV